MMDGRDANQVGPGVGQPVGGAGGAPKQGQTIGAEISDSADPIWNRLLG